MTTIHDIIMGPARPERACGDCVACCQVLNIDEPDMVKPADQMCMHCTGTGCSVYDSRPAVCREWDCIWRRIDSMPIETRPDRLGVVFTIDRQSDPRTPFDRLYFVGRAVDENAPLNSQMVRDVASMLAQGGPLPIFFTWGGNRTLVHPHEAVAAAILDPADAADPALVQEGKAWMERYEPYARLADEVAKQARRQG